MLAFATLALAALGAAQEFHTARYFDSFFLAFNGTLIVPERNPSGGTPYLWPGLQPPNNQGVLQPVLDGRNERWYFGLNYVGNPGGQPYGGGVNAANNERLGFYMVEEPAGSGNWATGCSNSRGEAAQYTYNIGVRMNQAIFAVEFYDAVWDFGNLVFEDVTVVGEGTDAGWCTANPNYSAVTIAFENVSSEVVGSTVVCRVGRATLSPP